MADVVQTDSESPSRWGHCGRADPDLAGFFSIDTVTLLRRPTVIDNISSKFVLA